VVDGQLSAGLQVDASIVLRLCWTLIATNLRRTGWRLASQDDFRRVDGIRYHSSPAKIDLHCDTPIGGIGTYASPH
jgi:hypothetical protein